MYRTISTESVSRIFKRPRMMYRRRSFPQETQFDLLQDHSCSDVSHDGLGSQRNDRARLRARLPGGRRAATQSEIEQLKSTYSILEIKDYLAVQQLAQKCGQKACIHTLLLFQQWRLHDRLRRAGRCPDAALQPIPRIARLFVRLQPPGSARFRPLSRSTMCMTILQRS